MRECLAVALALLLSSCRFTKVRSPEDALPEVPVGQLSETDRPIAVDDAGEGDWHKKLQKPLLDKGLLLMADRDASVLFLRKEAGKLEGGDLWSALQAMAEHGVLAVPLRTPPKEAAAVPPTQDVWPLGSKGIRLQCPGCVQSKYTGKNQALCQLDSGYAKNALFDENRIQLDPAHNFVETDGRKPFDSGSRGGGVLPFILPIRYHGTGAASVAVANPSAGFTPVAPGALYVPIRTSPGFVGFTGYRLKWLSATSQAALANGLRAVTKRASNLATDGSSCDVTSIAQGGLLPYLPLWEGLVDALDAGVIVVAAAGQIPKGPFASLMRIRPVFPARYSATGLPVVAVGGINPDGTPWSKAFRGEAVDVSAPATNIPHVQIPEVPCLESDQSNCKHAAFTHPKGEGTTYATGLTAGVALLWLEKHKGRAEILKHYEKAFSPTVPRVVVPCAFRLSVRRAVWDDKQDLRSQGYGLGVLDATALLNQELPPAEVVDACVKDFEAARKRRKTILYSSNDANDWERGSKAGVPAQIRNEEMNATSLTLELMKTRLVEAELASLFDANADCRPEQALCLSEANARRTIEGSSCVSKLLKVRLRSDDTLLKSTWSEFCGTQLDPTPQGSP